MSIQYVNAISNRLSLRPPQRDSLEILSRVCEIVSLAKDGDPATALQTVKSEFGTVEDFERELRQHTRTRPRPQIEGVGLS